MKDVLKVFLWGQEIGRLSWHDARKTTFFVYNPEFLKGTLDIAPLAASIIRSVLVPSLVKQSASIRNCLRSSPILCRMHGETSSLSNGGTIIISRNEA